MESTSAGLETVETTSLLALIVRTPEKTTLVITRCARIVRIVIICHKEEMDICMQSYVISSIVKT